MAETISKAEAATRAGKTPKTIGNWIRAGHLKVSRDEQGQQRIDLASLDAYLTSQGKIPAQLPDGVKGLPELVSLLVQERERSAQLQRRNTELEWVNGRLQGEIAALKEHPPLLLESGEESVSEAETEAPAWWDLAGRIRRSKWYNS